MKTLQQIAREAIDEFKTVHEAEFRRRLTDDEVQEIAIRLLQFFGILSHPPTDENGEASPAPVSLKKDED